MTCFDVLEYLFQVAPLEDLPFLVVDFSPVL